MRNLAPTKATDRTVFLLVHGAFHGAWCWDRLVPLLVARGHTVDAIDLRRFVDPDVEADVLLDSWAAQIVERAEAFGRPVTLVGHSRAGLVISEVAERAPHRVARLGYCAAMLVRDGETMAAARARLGDRSVRSLRISRDDASGRLVAEPETAAAYIYSRCSATDQAWAMRQMTPEPRHGFDIAPRLTERRFGSVPRAFIECRHDAVLSEDLRRAMRGRRPGDIVKTLDCDHAPYLSDPEGLSAALDDIARAAA